MFNDKIRCDAVYSGRNLPTFWKKLLYPSSVPKSKPNNQEEQNLLLDGFAYSSALKMEVMFHRNVDKLLPHTTWRRRIWYSFNVIGYKYVISSRIFLEFPLSPS
jgi:hypothetical protein